MLPSMCDAYLCSYVTSVDDTYKRHSRVSLALHGDYLSDVLSWAEDSNTTSKSGASALWSGRVADGHRLFVLSHSG